MSLRHHGAIFGDLKNMGKERKFRKDFTPEQYAAYLLRKAKSPDVLIPENKEPRNRKSKSKKKIG
jgi:hypothetical protein